MRVFSACMKMLKHHKFTVIIYFSVSVSYTHLDVYKRQIFCQLRGSGVCGIHRSEPCLTEKHGY